jgi:hypothetical protein
MTTPFDEFDFDRDAPYATIKCINFSVLTMKFRSLPFFADDMFLGMQAVNIGLVDTVITHQEYALLREYLEIEKTPAESALIVSALSQMWMFALYEVLRMWRDRRFQFKKWYENGGINSKPKDMHSDDDLNITNNSRTRQLERYGDDVIYRNDIDSSWERIEFVYRMVELFRMNLAKHAAPGKDSSVPRAPGYGRINQWCGSMDYELINKEGLYSTVNRRDIADALRACLKMK